MSSVAAAATRYFLQLARNALPDTAFVVLRKSKGSVFTAPITLEVYGYKGKQDPAELSPSARREEEFDIPCCISSFAGGEDLESRMTEAQDAWALLSVAVGNDYTLGNTVRWAQMTEYSFIPDVDANGMTLGSVEFTINCTQRIESLT